MQNLDGHSSHRGSAIFTIVVIGVMAMVGASVLSSRFNVGARSPDAVAEGLGSFQSYPQLQHFIAENAKSAQEYSSYGLGFGGVPVFLRGVATNNAVFAFSAAVPAATLSLSTAPTSYTGTNVQVQGVDEPDWVKTDGTNLFVSANGTVTILSAYPPTSASVLSTIKLPGTQILGLEIAPDRLMVIDQQQTNATYIDLLLYNTSNLSSPIQMANTSVAGTYVAARLAQGYLYAIIQQPSYSFSNGNATGVMPTLTENSVRAQLPPSSVYYTPDRSQISFYTMVVSVNMSSGEEQAVSVLTGPSSTIYVSTSSIYVVYSDYQQWYADNIPGDVFTGGVISSANFQQPQNSTIFRASYSNGSVTIEAVGSVPGTVLNQFSLGEYGNYFMVATSRFATIGGTATVSDDVYVLSTNMSQVSALRDIAPGENIYAVSFVGDMGYVVTYEQVDPLFVISFQNINDPVILSALKVTGYSDYLYPLPGGYLIGVGKDTVAASDGNFSYYLGLKLSLFQVSANGTSTDVSNVLIGDRGTDSPVLTDHLAFTYDPSQNITVIPVLLYTVSGNQSYGTTDSPPPYGNPVWQGVYVFRVTPQGFTLLGRVSQYPAGENYGDSPDGDLQISRSVMIGNDLYTVSQGEVMISDLSTFATVGTIQLLG
jgi:uncharacterized secreted protein with C-terminal beta-propeller domain